jgi:glycosyltransferase involved in cell wall biosynthesis
VLPSQWYETFGLTILESFAHGRPVVASRIGGVPEVVDDNVDGLLVPPGDVAALREKLAWMSCHREEAARMGRRGREKALERFGAEGHYQRLHEVYGRIL